MSDFWEQLFSIPETAYKESERMFPGQPWDDSQLDAARHLLFMGLLSQKTNPVVARMAGLGVEGAGLIKGLLGGTLPKDWASTKQDLINNEIALRQLSQAQNPEAVIGMVEQLMKQSQQKKPEELNPLQEEYKPVYYKTK